MINLPPSWSSSSFDAKKRKKIPREAIDKEIDNTESSSIKFNFYEHEYLLQYPLIKELLMSSQKIKNK